MNKHTIYIYRVTTKEWPPSIRLVSYVVFFEFPATSYGKIKTNSDNKPFFDLINVNE